MQDAVYALTCEKHSMLNANNQCEPCPPGFTGWNCRWPRSAAVSLARLIAYAESTNRFDDKGALQLAPRGWERKETWDGAVYRSPACTTTGGAVSAPLEAKQRLAYCADMPDGSTGVLSSPVTKAATCTEATPESVAKMFRFQAKY